MATEPSHNQDELAGSSHPNGAPASGPAPAPTSERQRPARLVSLDAFRGLTILGMLLVNNIALDVYTPAALTHAAWNKGVTLADLVFPWFLFIVGVAIPFSAASHRAKGRPAWQYDVRAFQRALTLVLLGCLLDSSIARTPLFDLGVLQLIGLAYLVAALLYDLRLSRRLMIAAALLLGYWAAIRFVPVPGVGAGVFTPDRNLIRHLNEAYLQPYHLSGLFSVIPTAAMAIMGSAVGDLFRDQEMPHLRKAAWLGGVGAGLVALGWVWNLDLPFNKPVWTPSYIVYTAGLAMLALAAFYLTVDVRGCKLWCIPLVVFGSNAILAYVAPILVKVYILQGWTWTMPDGSHLPLQQALLHASVTHLGRLWGGVLYTASYIVAWWLVLLVLYRKKLFLRV